MVTSNYQRIIIILKISTKSHAELFLLAQSYAALIINSLKLYIHTFFRLFLLNLFAKENAIENTTDLPIIREQSLKPHMHIQKMYRRYPEDIFGRYLQDVLLISFGHRMLYGALFESRQQDTSSIARTGGANHKSRIS